MTRAGSLPKGRARGRAGGPADRATVIGFYALNGDRAQSWPITNWTLNWFSAALDNEQPGTQQTIPIWILSNLRLPDQRPIVNVVALVLILLSLIPVYLALRMTRDSTTPGR